MKDMLLKFLKKTGMKSEFELFLNHFKDVPKIKFALIKISGATLDNHIDALAEDIAYLNKLDLYPIIVHGGGSRANNALVDSKKVNGYRVTPEKDMVILKKVFGEIAGELRDKIIEKGGRAAVVKGAIECSYMDKEIYGNVGSVDKINLSPIEDFLSNNITPIVSSLGVLADDIRVDLNINADTVAQELVKATGTNKMIFITETGGVLNEKGKIVPFMNLSNDDDLSFISGGMLVKINEIKNFISEAPSAAVVITSAEHLLQEIFTIKGSGTYIKDYAIERTQKIEDNQKEIVANILEDAFGKKLVDGYFKDDIKDMFYQENFEAVAIIREIKDVPYICKFAVADFRKGTGLGKALWNRFISSYPSIVWRSNPNNPINKFYISQCTGMIKKDKWHIFWKGINEDKVMAVVNDIEELKETFHPKEGATK